MFEKGKKRVKYFNGKPGEGKRGSLGGGGFRSSVKKLSKLKRELTTKVDKIHSGLHCT